MKQLLLSILIFLLPLPMVASNSNYDIAVENADGVTIYYNYINNGNELAVETISDKWGGAYSGDVIIPEEVTFMNRTRKVTSIDDYAFYNCSSLTSVTIPNSVTSIGDYAFGKSNRLTSVNIPNGVTSINNYVFYGCTGLTSVNIPNGVPSIGISAFESSGLTSVNIPNSVTSIGDCAFKGCRLTSVNIPNSVTSIGNSAFENCGLTSVIIPNSVTSIGNSAFKNCYYLTSVTIPNSVTSIGARAFDEIDVPIVISLIENPSEIYGKLSNYRTFSQNTFNNASLYVPVGTIDKYKETPGWQDFLFMEEGTGPNGGDMPGDQKCAKPTISVIDGKLSFSCDTEDVEYHYAISNNSPASGVGNDVPFSQKYTITVYASKNGYENSDTATAEITTTVGLTGDANGDGVVDAADVVKVANNIIGIKN